MFKGPKIRSMLNTFRKDERGVSVIEFSLLLPIMIALLLAGWEITRAMIIKKKADNAAMTASDLVTQSSSMSSTTFTGIKEAVESIMYPYNDLTVRLKIIGVTIKSNKKPKVDWTYSTGATLDVSSLPDGLKIANTFYVMSAAEVDYTPTFGTNIIGSMEFRDTSIMAPRVSSTIEDE